jgi:hypothetical protein
MLQASMWTAGQLQIKGCQSSRNNRALRLAAARYRQALVQAQVGRVVASLLGKAKSLLHLGGVVANAGLLGGRYAGMRAVPIRDIRGSEGRSHDFDADFRPLKTHNRSRWVGLASARLRGVVLPPVELIQVGGVYYVRDGHHRISVARAFGQEHIDAEVTIWDVAGPLPAGRMAYQP